jgi:hypothetical protein
MEGTKDASDLLQVEGEAYHASRPSFRIGRTHDQALYRKHPEFSAG